MNKDIERLARELVDTRIVVFLLSSGLDEEARKTISRMLQEGKLDDRPLGVILSCGERVNVSNNVLKLLTPTQSLEPCDRSLPTRSINKI